MLVCPIFTHPGRPTGTEQAAVWASRSAPLCLPSPPPALCWFSPFAHNGVAPTVAFACIQSMGGSHGAPLRLLAVPHPLCFHPVEGRTPHRSCPLPKKKAPFRGGEGRQAELLRASEDSPNKKPPSKVVQPFCPTGPGRLQEAPCKAVGSAASIAPEKGPRSAPTPHSASGVQSPPGPTVFCAGVSSAAPREDEEVVLTGSSRVAFMAFLAAFPPRTALSAPNPPLLAPSNGIQRGAL